MRARITPILPTGLQPVTALRLAINNPTLLESVDILQDIHATNVASPALATPTKSTISLPKQNINLPRSVYIAIAGTVVIGSIAGIFFLFNKQGNIPNQIMISQTIPDESKTIQTVTPTSVFITDKEDIITAVKTHVSDGTSLLEITLQSATTLAPLTPTEFFSMFEITVPLAFVSAINQIQTGTYRGQPWIQLNVSDTPTGQGGMFVWEQTIINDLRPWFSSTTRSTTQISRNGFTDIIINSRDVRFKKDSQNDYQIMYGFTNPNNILITTNEASWINLEQLLSSGG